MEHIKHNIEECFPYGLKQYNENDIDNIGIKIICTIRTTKIVYNSPELDECFATIKKECADKHIWVLYGSNDEKNWIPLQAASRSSGNVIDEIRTDFICMTPFDKMKDEKVWNSYFYKSVMKIQYGFDAKCQKYQKMKNMCNYLAIAVLKDEATLGEEDKEGSEIISKYQKKECDIANDIKPLFWNPAWNELDYVKQKG